MRKSALLATEALLRARFGPKALISRFDGIWVVHVDEPSEAKLQERLAELEHDLLEPDDCEKMEAFL